MIKSGKRGGGGGLGGDVYIETERQVDRQTYKMREKETDRNGELIL